MNYRIAFRLFVYGNCNFLSSLVTNWYYDGSKSAGLAVFLLLGLAYEMLMTLPQFFSNKEETVCKKTQCQINMRARGYGFIGIIFSILLFGFLMISAWNNRASAEGHGPHDSITEKLMKSDSPMYKKTIDKQ